MKKPTDLVVEKLRLKNSEIIQNGNSFMAQCPAHDDKTPSLSVSEGNDGKALIHCHAGCSIDSILDALDLSQKDLFPKPATIKQKEKIDAIYTYTDEQGNPLYEAVRFIPKGFKFRVTDKNGSQIWSLKGVRRVLYNLPQVLQAIKENQSVFIVEGEKDADSLIQLGLTATTNPMGAGKWEQDYTKTLQGAHVVLIPDNDVKGMHHMHDVAKQLEGIASSVKIVELPDLADKEDVTDWLSAGNTFDAFNKLVDATNLFQSSPITNSSIEKHNEPFYIKNYTIYSNGAEPKLVADFSIEIESIVEDNDVGLVYYVTLFCYVNGELKTYKHVEIEATVLDDRIKFHRIIRKYCLGVIRSERYKPILPVDIFKWLHNKFDKPSVWRSGYMGYFERKIDKRPFWLFENALICPPFKNHQGQIIPKNDLGEFIVDDRQGYYLPSYANDKEKEGLVPVIDIDKADLESFAFEIKDKLIQIMGGGDPTGKALNLGKILLGYVIYLLYENVLYYANDLNGHTVMLYTYGAKGTGKSTYFNTIVKALMGLHKTTEIKGNNVSPAAIENQMGHLSQLPVCYDEFNPQSTKIDYQAINSYYHRSGRSVSDSDRKGRNKSTPIRSSMVITSNYPIDLEKDQADATESRMIYLQYFKKYRDEDPRLFDWFMKNLNKLSRLALFVLLNQTDEQRKNLRKNYDSRFKELECDFKAVIKNNPKLFDIENRLIDNYSRILSSYEIVYGKDDAFKDYIFEHIQARFLKAKDDTMESKILERLIYLASSGKIIHHWQYYYKYEEDSSSGTNGKTLYIRLSELSQMFKENNKNNPISERVFKDTLMELFYGTGVPQTKALRWNGSYTPYPGAELIKENETRYSHVVPQEALDKYEIIKHIFPEPSTKSY